MEIFGQTYHDWFRRFLRLPNGIPSHDTFERVFERLDPRAFQRCFWSWTRSLAETLSLPQLAAHDKTLRASADVAAGLGPLRWVNAWATQH